MALVAGYHPASDVADWTLLGRNGGPVLPLRLARLFPCSPDGCRVAQEAAERFRDEHRPDAIDHIARVAVTGP